MIDHAESLEYLRQTLEYGTGRPMFLAAIPDFPSMPYAILYPIPIASHPSAPLSLDPGPWTLELQATTVGRSWADTSWLISRIDHELRVMEPPPGASDMQVICTVTTMIGETSEVISMIQRWRVSA